MNSSNSMKRICCFLVMAAIVVVVVANGSPTTTAARVSSSQIMEPVEIDFANMNKQLASANSINQVNKQLIDIANKGGYLRRQLQLINSLNGPDMATLIQASRGQQQQNRIQRSLSSLSSSSKVVAAPQAAPLPVYEDEQALKRQLPDLFVQAKNDRTFERALLRMLINSSLRSSLINSINNNQAPQDGVAEGGNSLDNNNDADPMLAKLQTLENYAEGIDPTLFDELNGQVTDQGNASPLDKREYHTFKPCSFNAVSCTRNPYRKVQ